jgi:hypothetical protein
LSKVQQCTNHNANGSTSIHLYYQSIQIVGDMQSDSYILQRDFGDIISNICQNLVKYFPFIHFSIGDAIPTTLSHDMILYMATAAMDINNLQSSMQNTNMLLDMLLPLVRLLSVQLTGTDGRVYAPAVDMACIRNDFIEWKRTMINKKNNFINSNSTLRLLESWSYFILYHSSLVVQYNYQL